MKLSLLLIAGMLAGCQSSAPRAPDQPPPPPHRGAGVGSSGTAGSGIASGMGSSMHGMSKDSWYAMCGVVRHIADAPTPEARQALIDKLMPGMSQASRDRHLRMMGARCGQ
jgi:hypothetical protein